MKPTGPILPSELVDELMRLSDELTKAHDDSIHWAQEFANAEHELTVAYASARVCAEGKDADTRKAIAESAVAEKQRRATHAELMRQSARDAENNIRQQMSALQTVAGTVRTEIEMAGRVPTGHAA